MNLVTLSQFPKIEIRFTHKEKTIILWVEKNNTFKDSINQIRKMFNISELVQIDMFCGNFFINEFYSTIPFFKLIEIFFTNKFNIIEALENPFNSTNLKEIKLNQNLLKNNKNLPKNITNFEEEDSLDLINKLKNDVKNIINIEERRDVDIKDTDEEFLNLQKKAKRLNIDDDIKNLENDDEEDYEIKELKEKLFAEQDKCDNLEKYMEKKFEKIISYKNQEKEALKLFKENKKIISNIYTNDQLIEDINSTIERLNIKSKIKIF